MHPLLGAKGSKAISNTILFKKGPGAGVKTSKVNPQRIKNISSILPSLPSKIIHMVVGHTHYIKTRIHQTGSKMLRHAEYITFGGILAAFGCSPFITKATFQVSKKKIAGLKNMMHRPQEGRTILSRRKIGA